MTTRRLLAALFVSILALAGCGSSGDDDSSPFGLGPDETDSGSDGDGTSDTSSESAGDGSDSGSSGEGSSPIPAPDGGNVIFEAAGQRQMTFPAGDFDRIVAFYEEWVAGTGGEWARSEAGNVITWLGVGGASGLPSQIIVEQDFQESTSGDLVTYVVVVGGS